jgi:hypothetical protein
MTPCKRHEWVPDLPREPWPPGRAEFDAVTAEWCSRCDLRRELSGQRFVWFHRLIGDWRGANLTRATFPVFDARDVDLTGANLRGLVLRSNRGGFELHNVCLDEADLRNVTMSCAAADGLTLRAANLRGLTLQSCGDESHPHWYHVDLTGADLRGADLRGISSSLSSAELFGARYDADTLWPRMGDPKRADRSARIRTKDVRIRAKYEALIRKRSANVWRTSEYARERAEAVERARREHVEYLAVKVAAGGPLGNLAAYLQDATADLPREAGEMLRRHAEYLEAQERHGHGGAC